MGRAEGQVVAGAVLQTSELSRGRPDLGMCDVVGDDDSQLPLQEHMSSVESQCETYCTSCSSDRILVNEL